VAAFLRPHGLDVACTPILAGALERAARETPAAAQRESFGTKAFRLYLLPVAVLVNLFSEGGAFHLAPRSKKRKRTVKKDKKDKKEKKQKASSKTVDATR
jgi:hypothetical protein